LDLRSGIEVLCTAAIQGRRLLLVGLMQDFHVFPHRLDGVVMFLFCCSLFVFVLCGEFLLEGAGFGLELEVLVLALLLEYQGFLLLLLEGLLEGSGCGLEGLDGLLVLELLGFGLGVVEEALVELSLDGFFVVCWAFAFAFGAGGSGGG
jgi:hypothetical protein